MVEYLQLGLKSCPFRSGTPPFLLGLGYVESGADNDPYQLSFFFILRILFLSLEAEASTHRYVVVTAQTDRGVSFCGSNKLPSGLIGRTTSCLLVSSIGTNVPVKIPWLTTWDMDQFHMVAPGARDAQLPDPMYSQVKVVRHNSGVPRWALELHTQKKSHRIRLRGEYQKILRAHASEPSC